MLKADGLWPVRALCVIDRESGGKEALARAGLELKSLFNTRRSSTNRKRGPPNEIGVLDCGLRD